MAHPTERMPAKNFCRFNVFISHNTPGPAKITQEKWRVRAIVS
jgi:hypothetical protein